MNNKRTVQGNENSKKYIQILRKYLQINISVK